MLTSIVRLALKTHPSHTRTKTGLNFLELKIPPVALVIAFALSMWLAHAYLPQFNFHLPFAPIVAPLFAFLGLLISTLGFLEFKRAKTTLNPTKPQSSSSLVKTGIYRRTRNPMYLGFLSLLITCATLAANLLAFLLLPLFIAYMNQFQIKPEERALTALFNHEFKSYSSTVRRWI